MKKILIFFILILFILNFILLISALDIKGSFTITGEAIEESEQNDNEESFLNSIKNLFIYAFTIGGKFEISPPSDEETGQTSDTGTTGQKTELEDKSTQDNQNETEKKDNKTMDAKNKSKTSKGLEIPKEIKQNIKLVLGIATAIAIIILLFLIKRRGNQ